MDCLQSNETNGILTHDMLEKMPQSAGLKFTPAGLKWFESYVYFDSFLRSICAPLVFERQFGHNCRTEVKGRKFYDGYNNQLKHFSFSFRICHEYRCVLCYRCRRYPHFTSIVSTKYVHTKYCLFSRLFFSFDFRSRFRSSNAVVTSYRNVSIFTLFCLAFASVLCPPQAAPHIRYANCIDCLSLLMSVSSSTIRSPKMQITSYCVHLFSSSWILCFPLTWPDGLFGGWNSACMWVFSDALLSRLQKMRHKWLVFQRDRLNLYESGSLPPRTRCHSVASTLSSSYSRWTNLHFTLFLLFRKSICHICHSKSRWMYISISTHFVSSFRKKLRSLSRAK